MSREEKITAIYKEMANKNFTLWCKINVKYRAYYHNETGGEVSYSKEDDLIVWVDWVARNGDIELSKADLSEADPNWYIESLETLVRIIWRPIVIGDVLDWIEPYWRGYAQDVKFSRERKRKIDITILQWDKKREPIEEQSDGCIDYVYSLIQK